MPNRSRNLFLLFLAAGSLLAGCATRSGAAAPQPELARQVEIRRTTHGVPHIRAENLRAAAFALAYVQLEDHGEGIVRGMQAARGRRAAVDGADHVDADAWARLRHARAAETFSLLHEDTREVYAGFAEGMNHFIRLYPERVPAWARPDFTPQDVLARDIGGPNQGTLAGFRRRIAAAGGDLPLLAMDAGGTWRRTGGSGTVAMRVDEDDAFTVDADAFLAEDAAHNVGSNAWALAPERTTSGRAILLRNPHLAWTAGYYEAHVRVPGKLDFYGDFRIGGPFTVIGGFNRDLGFSTTNNQSRSHEIYAFRVAPGTPDHILLDGAAVPLRRDEVSVEVRDGETLRTETRELWRTDAGPVVTRSDSLVYVLRTTDDGDYRAGEQWLEMMKAESLEAWQEAMRIQARTTSHFTYADRAGNIGYVWISGAPLLPHPAGGDTLAVLASRSDQVWSRVASFDALPQLFNPPGGYVRNENDSPHFTNLNRALPHDFPFWVESPTLRLRSQHGLELLHNDRMFSLEDVVETKHSMRMLLADRVKDDLLGAVRAAAPTGDVARAAELLARWENSAAADSRGGVLFETWWNRYRSLRSGQSLHAVEWSIDAPTSTPHGLAHLESAVEAFGWAVEETARRHGTWDVAWGEVHRVRRGNVDAPVGGCGGALGCFRVLNFETAEDGKRVVNGGDGWVLAVEFSDVPRAYTILGYGQSPNPESAYHADQAALFAAGAMKATYWTEEDIARATVRRYNPGDR